MEKTFTIYKKPFTIRSLCYDVKNEEFFTKLKKQNEDFLAKNELMKDVGLTFNEIGNDPDVDEYYHLEYDGKLVGYYGVNYDQSQSCCFFNEFWLEEPYLKVAYIRPILEFTREGMAERGLQLFQFNVLDDDKFIRMVKSLKLFTMSRCILGHVNG